MINMAKATPSTYPPQYRMIMVSKPQPMPKMIIPGAVTGTVPVSVARKKAPKTIQPL
jgi:hypothetical protein